MRRRTAFVLAVGLLGAGCTGLVSAPEPEPDELAEIKGRILELQRATAMTRVEIDRLRQQVAALEARLGAGSAAAAPAPARPAPPPRREPPPPAPATVEVTDLGPSPADRSPPPPASPPEPAAAPRPATPAPAPPPPASRPAAPVNEAAQALYDRGYTLYHQGRYVDAEASFRRFLQAHPDTALSDNAQYWIGESRFARQDYDGALAAFREVAARYASGNKVADSLLKAADCLQRLGDSAAARSSYDEVIRRFPGSAAAAMAEERRGQLPR